MAKIIKAKIENLKYRPGKTMRESKLKEYKLSNFDINEASASGIIEIDNKNKIAYSKWVTPKRTRSYPFARIYDTYSFGGKRITIIPVIKDEGIGVSHNKSNNDRINFITLSWMNLTNVFVILAWYPVAEKQDKYRITKQRFNVGYINKKIKEISEYQFDAHHWNNKHFTDDFVGVYKKAVAAYVGIAKKLSVQMHSPVKHIQFLNKIVNSNGIKIDLEKFAIETLGKSKLATMRESGVRHKMEYLSENSVKPIFEMQNNLGGNYYLTSDEIFIDKKTKEVIIQESKNTTEGRLPKASDIKDGLFKMLLFSQIKNMKIDNIKYNYSVNLKLTGKLSSSLLLPGNMKTISAFIEKERLSNTEKSTIIMLNEEAVENGYKIEISKN